MILLSELVCPAQGNLKNLRLFATLVAAVMLFSGFTLQLVLGKSSVVKEDPLFLSSNLCMSDKTFTFQCTVWVLGGKKAKKSSLFEKTVLEKLN